jgi:SAM-dependent methyltransferase
VFAAAPDRCGPFSRARRSPSARDSCGCRLRLRGRSRGRARLEALGNDFYAQRDALVADRDGGRWARDEGLHGALRLAAEAAAQTVRAGYRLRDRAHIEPTLPLSLGHPRNDTPGRCRDASKSRSAIVSIVGSRRLGMAAAAPPGGFAAPAGKIAGVLFEDRSRAESFGAVAELYDRARPTYPPALVDALLVDDAKRVLDVGCGTGIAGVLLAARGCSVLGVELDGRMAELARAKGLEVEVAPFELWEPGARRFDLMVSAQAWHWIEPRAGATMAAAALREGGRIALFWNFGDPPPRVRERLAPIYAYLEPGLENYSVLLGNHDARARETVAGITDSARFGPAEVHRFPWSQAYETAGWLDHLRTHSDHHALPPSRRERLLAAVGEAIEGLGGSFEMTYEAVLVSASRL